MLLKNGGFENVSIRCKLRKPREKSLTPKLAPKFKGTRAKKELRLGHVPLNTQMFVCMPQPVHEKDRFELKFHGLYRKNEHEWRVDTLDISKTEKESYTTYRCPQGFFSRREGVGQITCKILPCQIYLTPTIINRKSGLVQTAEQLPQKYSRKVTRCCYKT